MKYLLLFWLPVRWLEDQGHRRALYGVAVAGMPLLTGAAIVSDGTAQRVLAVLALLAGAGLPGLARRHTSSSGSRRVRRGEEGAGELELILLVATLVGVVLLLFRVHL